MHLQPGRKIKIPRLPQHLAAALSASSPFEDLLELCTNSEQVFVAAFLYATQKGFGALAATCKALYATRTWSQSLPTEDRKRVGWDMYHALEDVIVHLKTKGAEVARELAEQVPEIENRLLGAGLLPSQVLPAEPAKLLPMPPSSPPARLPQQTA